MTAEQKRLASLQMSKTVRELALAGVRARLPDAAEFVASGAAGGSVLWTECLPQLDGRLVSLREVQIEDAGQFEEFLSDPRVYRHVNPPPRDLGEIENWIRLSRIRRADGVRACFAINIKNTNALIGVGQIIRPPGSGAPQWGWSLAPAVWGSGIFVEVADLLRAFSRTHLGATELVAHVFAMNWRAEQALRKLGSQLVSTATPVHVWTTKT